MSENKQIKDSLFVDLFQNDVNAKANFLSLYNAISGNNLKLEETKIEPKRLEQVAYRSLYNDVSMLVNDKLIVLVEQQSTINENMPLRFLLYVARLYESIIPNRDRYKRSIVKIPIPEFYVIYNGTDDYPETKTLLLENAFAEKTTNAMLDLKVKVYNVNKCKELPIMTKCTILNDYCKFIDIIRDLKENGEEESYKKAIEYAIQNGILPDYLIRKVSEVINMLVGEYDYATDIEVQREEARALGLAQGLSKGLAQGRSEGLAQGSHEAKIETARNLFATSLTIEQIANATGLSIDEIQKLE